MRIPIRNADFLKSEKSLILQNRNVTSSNSQNISSKIENEKD